jgi:phage gpG-like protein
MHYSYLPTKNTFADMAVRVHASAEDMRADVTPMAQIAAYLDQWVQANFRTQGYNVGDWEPFKYGGRLTIKRKANAQSVKDRRWIDASAILEQRFGALRASFLPFYGAGMAGIGSDLPYAQFQSEGTRILPARRMLPVTSEVQDSVVKILSEWVMRKAQP